MFSICTIISGDLNLMTRNQLLLIRFLSVRRNVIRWIFFMVREVLHELSAMLFSIVIYIRIFTRECGHYGVFLTDWRTEQENFRTVRQ